MTGQYHKGAGDTERAGAAAISPSSRTIQDRVAEIFAVHRLMTDEELLERYELAHGRICKNSLEPRRYELVQRGRLEKTSLRRPGSSGVNRIVWGLKGVAPPHEPKPKSSALLCIERLAHA